MGPRLREARFDDYSGIARLEAGCGLKIRTADDWRHLWTGNPVYTACGGNWPIGWVLEAADGEVVGSIGNIPLAYRFQGKHLTVAAGRAWVADSRFRGYSLLLMDRFFAQRDVDLFLNTTVNARAAEAFSTFQPLRVPAGTWDESAFWITNHRGFVESLLARKGIAWPAAVTYPLSLPLRVKDKLTEKKLPARRDIEIQFRNEFDDRFDGLWEVLQGRRSDGLMGVRTRQILEWHFQPALSRNGAWLLTAGNGSSLTGYSIFCRKDNPHYKLKRMRLADFQSIGGDTSLLAPMLSQALQRCRAEGIHMLESIGGAETGVIAQLAPHRRKLPWSFFYKANGAPLAASLKDPRMWDPSGFDGDASL